MKDVRAIKNCLPQLILANLTLQMKEFIEKAWSEKQKDHSISQQYITKMGKGVPKSWQSAFMRRVSHNNPIT